jgi:signal peptidase
MALVRSAGIGLLWTGGGLALGLLLAATVPLALGNHPFVVRSGSMAPAVETGDVVVAEPIAPAEARVGDIVTFRDPRGNGQMLNHRVRAIRGSGERIKFTTQGDANTGQEHWTVAAADEIGRDLFRVPRLGYALFWIQTPAGRYGLIVVPAILLCWFGLARIWRDEYGSGDESAS